MTFFSGELSVALRQYIIYMPNSLAAENLTIKLSELEVRPVFENVTFKLEYCPCNRTITLESEVIRNRDSVTFNATTCGRDAYFRVECKPTKRKSNLRLNSHLYAKNLCSFDCFEKTRLTI